MTARKIRTSTSPELAKRDREALDRAIDSIREGDQRQPLVAALSDLSWPAAEQLGRRWLDLPPTTRVRIVQEIVRDQEEQYERTYRRALWVAVDDPLADVRLLAWQALWEDDSLPGLHRNLDRLDREPADQVRAVMAENLARWATLAAVGDLDENDTASVRGALLTLIRHDPSNTVRQRALESAGHIWGDAAIIDEIDAAYALDDDEWKFAALRAMGRQVDRRWQQQIGDGLSNREPEFRYEAVNAAGSTADQLYLPALIDLIDDEDREVQLAAIGAIGAIGGQMAVRTLRRLVRVDDEAVAEAAESALEEALVASDSVVAPPILGDADDGESADT